MPSTTLPICDVRFCMAVAAISGLRGAAANACAGAWA